MQAKINLARNILLSNFKRLAFPYKLTFAVTYKCNLNCKLCYIWKNRNPAELTLTEIERFFRASNRFSWIDITGGEIFLRKDIKDIFDVVITYCNRLHFLHFPTNGTFPDQTFSLVKRIIPKVTKLVVTVSIDGPPLLHNTLKNNPQSWEKAIETFQKLRQLKHAQVYLGMTLSSYNFDRIEDTYLSLKNIIKDLSFSELHFNIIQKSQIYFQNISVNGQLPPGAIKIINEVLKANRKIKSALNYFDSIYLSLCQEYLLGKRVHLTCQALSASCFINPFGDVFPCIIFDKNAGNIREYNYNLSQIWQSSSTSEARKQVLLRHCPDCWAPCEAYIAILGSLVKANFLYFKERFLK